MCSVRRRTRFAPSPTGFMHIGYLRSALYAWLVAKSHEGEFILRIEDTDRERYVEGATELIYETLAECGLSHDEGPDVGGPCGPYVQSERLNLYRPFAEKLVEEGKAYRCFCSKERLESLAEARESGEGEASFGYDRHCRDLSPEEIQKNLDEGKPYVIRQKMPLEGETTYHDEVYGDITIANKELEDQILLKSDGFPTYNFANVIDDHEMGITHVVRGCEYLSSTPKYNLLYEAFGWEKPVYIHLPLILGTDGKKLSKRHGATSFADLRKEGYLTAAILNYLAFLGWAPGSDTREIFSLEELREVFDEKHISKAPAVFDYQKLRWMNGEYLKALDDDAFAAYIRPYTQAFYEGAELRPEAESMIAEILHSRIESGADLAGMLNFLKAPAAHDNDLYLNKKQKLTPALSRRVLEAVVQACSGLEQWDKSSIYDSLMGLKETLALKTGQVMGPPRLALSGQQVTPGGAVEIMTILGREESLARMQSEIEKLPEADPEA